MTSVVSICNLALSNIGKDNIQSLNDAGAEARACRQFYEQTRDLLLQTYVWRFAGKSQSLAEVTNDKLGEWRYAYARPNDCLKIREIRHDPDPLTGAQCYIKRDDYGIAYDIEGDKIYCDASPAVLRYTFRLTDPTKFSPLFVEALAWHLSVRLAMPLTRDPKVRQDAFTIANGAQASAQEADANEQREWSDIDSELVEARG